MLKGFRDFIFRGNVIDLAVAVVIGAAFTALVAAFGSSLITPIVNSFFALIGIGRDSIGGSLSLPGDQVIDIGAIVGAAITFVITALIVYFVFVAPMNLAKAKLAKEADVDDDEPIDTALLREIRDLLRERSGGGQRSVERGHELDDIAANI